MPSYSVVVEMENAATVDWSDVGQSLRVLAEQIAALTTPTHRKPQVILAHPGTENESADLIAAAGRMVPELATAARVQAVALPNGATTSSKTPASPERMAN